jgi:hypothetical protein
MDDPVPDVLNWKRETSLGLSPWVAWAGVITWFAYLFLKLTDLAALASLADDSSNYLAMARCVSPWGADDIAALSVCQQQYFPWGFPLLLGLLGLAHSLPLAHAAVIAAFLASLPCLWRHAALVLHSRALAHVLMMFCVVLPGTLLGLQGILSESWYLLLSAAFIAGHSDAVDRRPVSACLAGILLGLVVTSRSIGLVLPAAVLVRAVVTRLRSGRVPPGTWLELGACAAVLALFSMLTPERVEVRGYGAIWDELFASPQGLVDYLGAQVGGLTESWASFIALYWSDERPLTWASMMFVLAISLGGVALRLVANRLDALYVAGYLAVLLVWPYPGQMFRFLFPIMPFLLLNGAWLLVIISRRYERLRLPLWIVPGLVAALALPSHAFLMGRAELAREDGLSPVYEWYRKPALVEARRELGLQNRIFADFAELDRSLPGGAVVGFYEPSYVTVLSARKSVPLPYPVDANTWRTAREAGATHVFLTRIHPRLSRSGIDGLAIVGRPPRDAELMWCSRESLQGLPASCLYALALVRQP